jgi:hypothetical protein
MYTIYEHSSERLYSSSRYPLNREKRISKKTNRFVRAEEFASGLKNSLTARLISEFVGKLDSIELLRHTQIESSRITIVVSYSHK